MSSSVTTTCSSYVPPQTKMGAPLLAASVTAAPMLPSGAVAVPALSSSPLVET
jgi:hypothetical protein